MEKLRKIFLSALLLCLVLPLTAQRINLGTVTVKEAIDAIRSTQGYSFVYSSDILDTRKQVTVDAATLEEAVSQIVAGQKVSYRMDGNNIIITPAQKESGKPGVTLTGTVVDESGQPVIGAGIVGTKTGKGTITNLDGVFSMTLSPEDIWIEVSSLGYQSQEIRVANQRALNIILKEDTRLLDEAVVIGYGTTNRKNLTTAIATVKTENISKSATSNMSQLLLGRAAGMNATMTSTQPGGNVSISIRGGGTPVFVVDGVVMPSGSLEVGNGNTVVPQSIDRSGLAGLNPQDIESVEVLKDASAAIYGIGAADGVVLITTRSGAGNRPQVTYDGSYSLVRNYRYLEPLDAQSLMKIQNLFNKENYLYTNGMYPYGTKEYDYEWEPQFSPATVRDAKTTKWLDFVLKDGYINNHNVTLNGGTQKVKYYLSANYYDQDGTVVNSSMSRLTLRSNISAQILPFLRFTGIINVNQTDFTNSNAEGGENGNGYAALQTALAIPSYLPVYDENGDPSRYRNYSNPKEMTQVSDKTRSQGYYFNIAADANLYKDILTARVVYGENNEVSKRDLYIPSYIYFFQMFKSRGHYGYAERKNRTLEATVSYKQQFGDFLRADAVIGVGRYWNTGNGLELDYEKINDSIASDKVEASEAPENFHPTSNRYGNEKRSQFARASLDVLDRYVVSGTLRRDGTDKFFPGKKYALFPSVSLAWKVSNEPWLKNLKWLNQLKLRGSIGLTGSDNLGATLYSTYILAAQHVKFLNNTVTYIPYLLSGANYDNVSWQKTNMKNLGVDFSVLDDRIWGSFDIWRNDVTDLLGRDASSPLAMTATEPVNYGHYVRYGWDATLNTINLRHENIFRWQSVLTLSHYKAVWIERQPNYDYEEYRYRINEPMNAVYYYATDGIINIDRSNMPRSQTSLSKEAQMPGYPIIKDVDGDGEITTGDILMRDGLPKITIGFGNTFTYKNFDLDIFMYGQLGKLRYNYAYAWARVGDLYYLNAKNTNKYAYEIWNSQDNPDGKRGGIASTKSVALPGDVGYETDVEDASFLRVRNITFCYNLSGSRLGRLGKMISNLRVYLDTQNPFTFTRFEAVDPEINIGEGNSKAEYPMTRSFTIGAQIKF